MRVLADTNLYISYLLRSSAKEGSIHYFFQAFLEGKFTLLMPRDLLDEIVQTASSKPHLQKRISKKQVDELVSILEAVSEEIPRIEEPIPQICRDPKDNYLLAYAVVGQADYLVTGDEDLLVLRSVETVEIVTPPRFQEMLSGDAK